MTSDRIQSLDGLRAISIGLVVIAHLGGTAGFPFSATAVGRYIDVGNLGVRIFFVISGFLITTLLLREYERSATVELRRFYFRRTLRIFPPFYLFLAAIWVASVIGLGTVAPSDLIGAATYTINYHQEHGFALSHTWSLAVEEQFYLLWPALIVFLGPKRAMKVALAFVVAGPILRCASIFLPALQPTIGRRFDSVADAIAVGCLLAGYRNALWNWEPYRRVLSGWWWWSVVVVLGAATMSYGLSIHLWWVVGISIANIAIAVALDRLMRFPSSNAGRVLNWWPMVRIGVMSYSLYIWQQPFLDPNHVRWFTQFPVNIGVAALAALASFYLVERPSLRLRERWESRWVGKRSLQPL